MEQNRFTSVLMWSSVLAQTVIIMQVTGLLTISEIEIVNGVATAVLQILVLLGVLNNPTSKDKI